MNPIPGPRASSPRKMRLASYPRWRAAFIAASCQTWRVSRIRNRNMPPNKKGLHRFQRKPLVNLDLPCLCSPSQSLPHLTVASPRLATPYRGRFLLNLLQLVHDLEQLHSARRNFLIRSLPARPCSYRNLDLPRGLRQRQAEFLSQCFQFWTVQKSPYPDQPMLALSQLAKPDLA